jgi:hypothetical protein
MNTANKFLDSAPESTKRIRVARRVNIQSPKSVVAQTRMAFSRKYLSATTIGILLGGVVPTAAFLVAHNALDMNANLLEQVPTYFVIGALCFSAPTVYSWCKAAFNSSLKALGWVLLIEGVMVSPLPDCLHPLAWICLGYLVCINAVATGCNLSLKR